jgi:hypothetical protein
MEYAIKILSKIVTLAVVFVSLMVSGCSGFEGAIFPAVPSQSSVGTIQGSVFGGHAPIVNSHVFLLEATGSGYATMAKSLLSASSTATSTTYPVTQDQTPGSVTNGLYYVTSDGSGAFNISGDYRCDIGDPVYLYLSGGSPNIPLVIDISGISATASHGTYTYTFSGGNLLYAGQSIQFSNTSLGGEWAVLNATTQTILATPTSSSFQIATTRAPGSGANIQTGTVISVGATNPAIVDLGLLGVCPSAGNFSYLNYVYINEVSTVAMGYAMAGFAYDGLHIGTSATNLTGLQNAALNAANLYNIQGAPLGIQYPAEGQIANQITVAGNGTVPQAELNTLANILAACVDSANTAITQSASCNTLFADATSTGLVLGVKPIDTAMAVMNMAHNPGTPNVVALWNLTGGVVPFSPVLTIQPNDVTVAIIYNNIAAPGGLAIDAGGNAFVPTNSSTGYVTKLSPAGKVLATSAIGGSGFSSIAADLGGNVFAAASGSNALYAFTSSLGVVTGSPWTSPQMSAPTSVAIDNNGYVYVADGGNGGSTIQKFSNTASTNPVVSPSASITNACLANVSQIALDPSGYLWATINSSDSACRLPATGGSTTFSFTNHKMPEPGNIAIDSNGNGWIATGKHNSLFELTPTGSSSSYGDNFLNNNGNGQSSSTWVAIDGKNNVWVTNGKNSFTLSEFDNNGSAITGASYQSGNLDSPSYIAIDGSGDIWIPNQSANTVTQIIGGATPTVTPLSALKPGVRP